VELLVRDRLGELFESTLAGATTGEDRSWMQFHEAGHDGVDRRHVVDRHRDR
jgi:hypothetical protein